ncbi:MAG TPA: glutamate--tRNA ligase [Acidobacteriota bacterium]|nr:glutamate--tRNA ligase [Acidobacteriota bacterium]
MSVRVRFAPSPTGHLHIGGARTALFNWLFARQNGGTFVLRIEDTDQQRSDEEMVQGILEGLTWLGLDWDEGPFFQSRQLESHRAVCQHLLETGWAYRDFSAPNAGPESHRAFRNLSSVEMEECLKGGEPFAVRFKVPEDSEIQFEDLVFGPVTVETNNLEDFVILRSDGYPTYHLSVVADDIEMGITHVIRGADHLSNTGKHVLLYQALDKAVPTYAHLPLILGPDKKRLSKRHGATSVTEYRGHDLLSEAVRNYIALLGWSAGDDSEIFSSDELIQRFKISRISKANAVFDYTKLEWMNKRYISSSSAETLEAAVLEQLQKSRLWRSELEEDARPWFLSVIDLLKTRVQNIPDFTAYGRAFFTDDFPYDEAALAKYLKPEQRPILKRALSELRARYEQLPDFTLEATEEVLREIATQNELKAGQFIGAVRVACTGRAQAPGIFDVLVALGQTNVLARLDRLIQCVE